jgi:3',5'-cyclic AMP phosphodiesterase CpdA
VTTLAHISDLHVGKTPQEWKVFERWLDRLEEETFDALVISGDLVHTPDDDVALRRVADRLEAYDRPSVVVPGNHDVLIPGENRVFERYFGEFPRVQRYAGVDFALFDSHGGLPVAERTPIDRDTFARQGAYADGRIGEEQFAAVTAQLGSTDHRVAVVHHFLFWEPNRFDLQPLQDTDALLDWCDDHDVRHVFVGHLHTPAAPKTVRGVTRHRVGRSTKEPFTGALVDLTDGAVQRIQI